MHTAKKKSFFVAVVCLILCVALLVGTTFAWFTDSVSNTGNRIQAGNLQIDLLKHNGTDYVSVANQTGSIFGTDVKWEPGQTQFAFLAVENKGNLALKYNTYIDVTDGGLVGSLEYALVPGSKTDIGDLSGKTWDYIKALTGAVTGDVTAGRTPLTTGVLDEIAHTPSVENECDYVLLAVHMKEAAGNEYQNKNVVIDVTLSATQMTAEEDGFGSDQYDASAVSDVPSEPVHETVNTDSINNESSEATAEFNASGAVTSASLPMTAAKALIPTTGTEVAGKAIEEGENVAIVLQLNVNTTEQSTGAVKYEIDLSKVTTVTGASGTRSETTNVTETLSDFLTATISLNAGLQNVSVTHNDNAMEALESAASTPTVANGGYFYDTSSGILTIKSKTFSPFKVSYDVAFACGDGTKDNPYIISNEDYWRAFVKLTENDSTFANTDGKYFKVTTDIDVSDWTERANIHYFAGSIDFDNHEFTGLTAVNAPAGDVGDDGITAVFSRVSKTASVSNLKFITTKIVNGSHTVAAQVAGRNTGNVVLTFTNVDTYGSVSGTNINNNGLLLAYVYNGEADIVMTGCDNYANITGSGYKSVFLGNMGYGTVKTITATQCNNYGTIVSTNAEAAMFVANPGYFTSERVVTITDCTNYGTISQNTTEERHNLFVTRNDSQYLYTVNGNDMSTMTDSAFNDAVKDQLKGSLVNDVSETGTIQTSGGKFVLNATDNAVKYELAFSFTAGGTGYGGGAGYTMVMTPAEQVSADINVYDWINLADASEEVVAHNQYQTTYYTSGSHYVFNKQGATIRDKVFVTYTAFGENNTILSMQTYQYE